MKVVVLHSGGLDSTVLLAHCAHLGQSVISLGVNYGQRHARELSYAERACEVLGIERVVVDMSDSLGPHLSGSSLTDASVALPEGHYADESMKATVVPNRNMVLLSVAGAVAVARGAGAVAYAAHAGDHTIYPDCRPGFAAAMDTALSLCDWNPVELWRPFIGMSKAQIVSHGIGVKAPMWATWSCYAGREKHCGKCGTCCERIEAFELSGVKDPTEYE
jgi:7-cyano-7-deazaguanine synthase